MRDEKLLDDVMRDGITKLKAMCLMHQSELHPTWVKKEKPLPKSKSMYHN